MHQTTCWTQMRSDLKLANSQIGPSIVFKMFALLLIELHANLNPNTSKKHPNQQFHNNPLKFKHLHHQTSAMWALELARNHSWVKRETQQIAWEMFTSARATATASMFTNANPTISQFKCVVMHSAYQCARDMLENVSARRCTKPLETISAQPAYLTKINKTFTFGHLYSA